MKEKISFEYDDMSTTSYGGSSVSADGTHVRVNDWDVGTTESGSSGSPLFNGSHRIIGRLHWGFAACNNNFPDWYGRFYKSWFLSNLAQYLDPNNVLGGGYGGVDTFDPYYLSPPTTSPSPWQAPTPSLSQAPTPLECPNNVPKTNIAIEIVTDDFPSEITWTLVQICSSAQAASGGPYSSSLFTYNEEVLNCDGQYKFKINDSWGDGICCGRGNGSYSVKKDGVVVAYGNSFGNYESTIFGSCCLDSVDNFDVTKPDGSVISGRDCTWVGEHSFRCDFDGIIENCPATCDACPDECINSVDSFDVTKPDGSLISGIDCAWVGGLSWRCDFDGAIENCPATCHDECQPAECVDSIDTFDVIKPNGSVMSGRDCAWVGEHSFRCNFDGAVENCPATCNVCSLECAGTTYNFDVTKPNGDVITDRDCVWVGEHSFRCDFDGAIENCPVTCNACSLECAYSTGRFDVTKPNGIVIADRDCVWVGEHSFRCDFDGAVENCPATCDDACLD